MPARRYKGWSHKKNRQTSAATKRQSPSPSSSPSLHPVIELTEDSLTCSICFHPWTCTGDDRVVALTCGHMFGHKCIKKWIKVAGSCPSCHSVVQESDIRILYPEIEATTAISSRWKELLQEKELEIARLSSNGTKNVAQQLTQVMQYWETDVMRLKAELLRTRIECQGLRLQLQEENIQFSDVIASPVVVKKEESILSEGQNESESEPEIEPQMETSGQTDQQSDDEWMTFRLQCKILEEERMYAMGKNVPFREFKQFFAQSEGLSIASFNFYLRSKYVRVTRRWRV